MIRLFCLFVVLVCALAANGQTTHYADSVDRADVAAKVTAASSGDTIVIPAGSATWTSQINLGSKNLTITGRGSDSTIITLSGNIKAFDLDDTNSKILALKLIASYSTSVGEANTIIRADCNGWFEIGQVEIDCDAGSVKGIIYADSPSGQNDPKGLIWGSTFHDTRIVVRGDLGTGFGRDIYALSDRVPGTANTVFVEDCTFTIDITGNVMDDSYGGHYVFRYNTVTDATIEAHGITGSGERANKFCEVYGNTMIRTGSGFYRPMFLRGGTFMVFDNEFTGPWEQEIQIDSEASRFSSVRAGGVASANDPWPGREAEMTGTHDGSDNAATLADSSQSWTTDEWVTAGAVVMNETDGSFGYITANTATTATLTLSGGTDNDFDIGDSYTITDGWLWRDQIGAGTDAFEYTGTGPWPAQERDPAYQWNNIHDGTGIHVSWSDTQADFEKTNTGNDVSGASQQRTAVADRDFFNYTTSFDGTSGVGRGTAAQMAAITPTTDYVGFWVTDEGEWNSENAGNDGRFYVWNGASWVLNYTPYAYPHPLRTVVELGGLPYNGRLRFDGTGSKPVLTDQSGSVPIKTN